MMPDDQTALAENARSASFRDLANRASLTVAVVSVAVKLSRSDQL
jgi:hypothetical protein